MFFILVYTQNENVKWNITYPHFRMLDMTPVQPDQMFFLDSPWKELNSV